MDLSAVVLYGTTLLLYFFIYNILTWGLNIEFGYAGIPNFAYIVFLAVGAYFTGVLGVPPAAGGDTYILGLRWAFPFTLLGGAFVAALVGLALGAIALGRLRSDFLALTTFAIGFVAYGVVSDYRPLFNGFRGISGVTPPLIDFLKVDYNTYTFIFVGLAGLIMLLLWLVANRIYDSGFGRSLRAVREDAELAAALGKNTFALRLKALVIGSVFAGVAGALTIEYLTAFNPSSWDPPNTFLIWTALLIGGRGNNLGSILGALLVAVIFVEVTRFLPPIPGHAGLVGYLRFVAIGALLILTLWFRPSGILPERRRLYEIPIGAVR